MCGFAGGGGLHTRFRRTHKRLSPTEASVCLREKKAWFLCQLCSFLSSSCLFCSISDLCRGHSNNSIASFTVLSQCCECYCPPLLRGKPRTNFLVFSTKAFVSSVPAAPTRREIPPVGFLSFSSVLSIFSPGCRCRASWVWLEWVFTEDRWTNPLLLDKCLMLNTRLVRQNFSGFQKEEGHSPKHMSRTIRNGFALHLSLSTAGMCPKSSVTPPKSRIYRIITAKVG